MTALEQRVAFVTGATSGFGAEIARRLAKAGARLVIAGRRQERLEALKEELGGSAHAVALDVREREAVFRCVDSLPTEFREVDLLVNNAGLALGLEPAHRASLDDWERMVDTNIKGVMYCTRALLPGMVARDRGHVVNIGSIAASYPYAGGNAYGGSKAFVQQFSRNLRADLLGTRVRVTNVEPGLSETEFSLVRFHGDAERAKKVYEGTQPLTAADIAECVLWALTMPAHVNINTIEVMPVCQAPGGAKVQKQGA